MGRQTADREALNEDVPTAYRLLSTDTDLDAPCPDEMIDRIATQLIGFAKQAYSVDTRLIVDAGNSVDDYDALEPALRSREDIARSSHPLYNGQRKIVHTVRGLRAEILPIWMPYSATVEYELYISIPEDSRIAPSDVEIDAGILTGDLPIETGKVRYSRNGDIGSQGTYQGARSVVMGERAAEDDLPSEQPALELRFESEPVQKLLEALNQATRTADVNPMRDGIELSRMRERRVHSADERETVDPYEYPPAQPEHSLKYTFEDYRSRRWFEQDRTFYVVAPQFEARLEVRYDPFGVGAAGSLAPVFGDRAGAAVEEELASSAREASDGSGNPESGGPESGDPFKMEAQANDGSEADDTRAADLQKEVQETFVVNAVTEALYPRDFDVEAFERTPVGLVAKRIEREHNTAHRFSPAITMEEAIERARAEEPQTRASVEQVQLPAARPDVS